jgi:hypothetical protein
MNVYNVFGPIFLFAKLRLPLVASGETLELAPEELPV